MTLEKSLGALMALALATGAWAAGIVSLDNPASIPEQRSIYAYGTAFTGSDFSPIREIRADLRDDYAPRDGRNLVLVHARAGSGVEWQGFRLGAIYRSEWLAEAQKDTLDVYRSERLSSSHALGANYAIGYEMHGFEARGLQLGKAFRQGLDGNWTLAWGASASLLQGRKLRSETWSGSAVATAARAVTINGDLARIYSELDTVANGFIPAYRDGNPGGQGYAIDLGLSLQREDGTRFEWAVGDAVSRMRWSSIPEMTLSGSNVYNGTFPSGRKWRVDPVERLPVKHALSLSMPVAQVVVELADTVMRGYHFPRIGVRQRDGTEWRAQADYDFRFRTLGLGLTHRWFYLHVQSDALNVKNAKAFGLGAGARIEF